MSFRERYTPPLSSYKMMSITAYTADLNVQLLKTIDRHKFLWGAICKNIHLKVDV